MPSLQRNLLASTVVGEMAGLKDELGIDCTDSGFAVLKKDCERVQKQHSLHVDPETELRNLRHHAAITLLVAEQVADFISARKVDPPVRNAGPIGRDNDPWGTGGGFPRGTPGNMGDG